jgi:hypothetical protein
MKGVLQPDHIPVNKYELQVIGMPSLVFTEISGLEEELDTATLPDRTVVTGGASKAVEFTVKQPAHHTVEVAAMEAWYTEAKDPVTPTYKKNATLIMKSGTGQILRTFSLIGTFPKKRKTPDLDMSNEGEMAAYEWTMSCDEPLPI